MKRTLLLCALGLLTAGHMSAASAMDSAQRLTLKEAIGTALRQNNLIKAATFTAEAAGQAVAIADARLYPSLYFEETFAASNAPTQTFMMKLDQGRFSQNDFQISSLNHPATHHDFKTALTLHQPLYTPSTGPLREMAAKEAEQGSLGLEVARQEIAFQTFRIYLEVQRATAQQAASEQALNDARENLRLAKVRNEAGLGLRSDELRARTHLATIEQHTITAHNNLILSQLQLANTVGLGQGIRAEIAEPTTALAITTPEQQLALTALESRSDLQLARVELERSSAAMKLARSAYLPTVSAFASYQMNDKDAPVAGDNDSWLAGISLKWQLFDGFKRCHERDRAVTNRSAAGEMLANRTRESSYQVTESYLRHTESSKRLEVARHALLDAEETVRLLTKRFENSLATMVELLDAQTALNQVRANLVDSEASFALAGGRIYYTAGIFLKEIMK